MNLLQATGCPAVHSNFDTPLISLIIWHSLTDQAQQAMVDANQTTEAEAVRERLRGMGKLDQNHPGLELVLTLPEAVAVPELDSENGTGELNGL